VADRNQVACRDRALANAMRASLRDSGLEPSQIGHIHAHGLSTRSCDIDEAKAITDVFGQCSATVPVAAAKSYFGNLGAGSGLVELIASVLALGHRRLFPILNFETPDPECPIVPARSTDDPGDSFLNLSVTPQGQASCVVVKRFA
jgi:3-oxoacyl-[acyl-carrier-protein] synthase II